ncbi:MAG: cytochrome P450 [Spirulinaceae cyanobacterium SM2_1_0]|nr:cytochrome P450 [Spirulinaceae cyanobacterium SM2_1_0]
MVILPNTIPGPTYRLAPVRFWQMARFAADSVGIATDLFGRYGSLVALSHGGGTQIYSPEPDCPGTVLVKGRDANRQIAQQSDVFYKYPLSGRLYRYRDRSPRHAPLHHFGVGLFGANEGEHQQQRQLLMPVFGKAALESYWPAMVAIARTEIDRWPLGEVIDVAAALGALAAQLVTRILLGAVGSERARELLQRSLHTLGQPGVHLLPFAWPGLPFRQLLAEMAALDEEMRTLISQARSVPANGDRQSIIARLLTAHDPETGHTLSEVEILGHVGSFFAAGHETSANALTWTLLLLSQHPDTAAALDEEVASLGTDPPTLAAISALPQLDRIVQESLRALSPVPWNGRVVSRETELLGYPLPAGTEIMASLHHTHHDPELYPQPRRFDPDRWLDSSPDPFGYVPFSAGPRTCIGRGFAVLEIKLVLALICQRYRLQFVPTVPIDRRGFITLSPAQGLPMRVCQRDRQFQLGVGDVQGNVHELVDLPT